MTPRLFASAASAACALAALLAGCAASAASPEPHATAAPTGTAVVALTTGHCWVEPVRFQGELWGLPFAEQFGWGGLGPDDWRSAGVLERVSADRVRYVDDGGAVLTLRPVDDPAVRRVERAFCD